MNLPRFGEASENDVNVTNPSRDFVAIEHPDDQYSEEDPSLGKTLANFVLKQQERALEREYDIDFGDDKIESAEKKPESDAKDNSAQPAGGKYVPPSQRGGAGAAAGSSPLGKTDRDLENTIRVSNLTKRITEEDLRDLFQRFGQIMRVSLPRDSAKEPRGFAYVAFQRKEDAIKAMDRLQGHGYDHLILKLEWAKPPSNDGPPGGGGLSAMGFVSGYGQKLAQETKEQVSYASNLTGNR
jgi:RNA recognition motif-containing protein